MYRYFIYFLAVSLFIPVAMAKQLVLHGATLYDGNGGAPVNKSVVVVEKGIIKCVGVDCEISTNAELVDVSGKYITPGLTDSHVHYAASGWFDTRQVMPFLHEIYDLKSAQTYLQKNPEELDRSYLCSGVTAVFDTGSFPWTVALQETSIANGNKPRFVAAGQLITHDSASGGAMVLQHQKFGDTHEFLPMNSDEEALESVAAIVASGASAVKVWFVPPAPERAAELRARLSVIADAAHRNGLSFIVHANTLTDAKVAVRAGADVLVHSVRSTLVDDEFIELMKSNDVTYQTTMSVFLDAPPMLELIDGDAPHFDDPNGCISPRTRALVTEGYEIVGNILSKMIGRDTKVELMLETGATIFRSQHNLKRLYENGVAVAAATDAGNPHTYHGPSIYGELELIQAAGVPAEDIIVMVTKNGAKAMGLEATLGTLEVGKNADLVIVKEDPGKDISAYRTISHVMRFGQLHPITALSYRTDNGS